MKLSKTDKKLKHHFTEKGLLFQAPRLPLEIITEATEHRSLHIAFSISIAESGQDYGKPLKEFQDEVRRKDGLVTGVGSPAGSVCSPSHATYNP